MVMGKDARLWLDGGEVMVVDLPIVGGWPEGLLRRVGFGWFGWLLGWECCDWGRAGGDDGIGGGCRAGEAVGGL
jgi:hypothetical protein